MAKQRYFNSVPLIDNLYPDNRKREGRWRYRWPDGSFQNFEAATVQEANAFAIEANQVREQKPQTESPESALPYWAEKYIEHREAMDPGLANKSSWVRRNRAAIRQFAKQFGGTPVFILSLKHIRPWWDSLTGAAQRNKKPELNRFCNHLIAEEVTSNLQPHPFNILMMRPAAHKKRARLSLEAYWTIYKKAPDLGLDYIQDAMAIALLTFMRRSDICSLRFDEHTNGEQLWKVISKAAAQGKLKRLIWNFERWPELRAVVARCRERSMKHKRCPYLISKKPERRIMGDVKNHFYQVLPDMLSEDFTKVRDATGLFNHLPPTMRPGIHEVRSTGSFLYEDEADQTKVMNAMAHSDIEMTRHYQSGHKIEEIEIDIEELPIAKLGGQF
ncbi:tyrosine-type recombinase/integrase [uncultured Amphritea sp.]|uniref:tyrosine-type recombinase/integrase n=1 Tax=uncultured Amphritea sp. TaxID=981605 RepID=UPI0026035A1C|nr:tyrosine-type recombinase/integrase [uncultured Amphritea sp.]